VVEGDAVAFHQRLEGGVVGDDGRDVHRQLAALPAEQQVVQAVAVLAHHQQHAGALGHGVDAGVHAELLAHGAEQAVQGGHVGQRGGGLEVHAHEEQAGGVVAQHVAELLRVDDVAARLVKQAGNGVDDALGVAAGQGQDEFLGSGHGGRDCTKPCPWGQAGRPGPS